jgi:hypothetical protein
LLVVVTLSKRVAEWARRPIVLGPGLGAVTPLVLGPRELPEILDRDLATENPELAVLSAIAHGKDRDVSRWLLAASKVSAVEALFSH